MNKVINAVPTQEQLFYQEQRKLGERDQFFFDLVKDPVNPLTNDDLEQLVAKFPQCWERYSGFIGKLPH
jgi:hypothetical protein